jgi:flagellin-like hook-associated protein FlgL
VSESEINGDKFIYNEDFVAENPPDNDVCNNDEKAEAATQGNLRIQISDIQLAQRIVNLAVSIVQKFTDTTTQIHNLLLQMQTLAQKASGRSYSISQKTAMQYQLEELANQINQLVSNTAYLKNKFLAPDSKPILFYIAKDRMFELAPADLSIDIKNLNLTQSTLDTLTFISNKLKQANMCLEYFSSQSMFLDKVHEDIEKEFAKLMAVGPDDININAAYRLLNDLADHILIDVDASSLTQHNVETAAVARLLK